MFSLKSNSLANAIILASKTSYLRYHIQTLASLSPSSASEPKCQQSLTVSYLTNTCGLSLEKAISASKLVNIECTKNPDSVLELLRAHGFTSSDIAALVSKCPPLILANPSRTLKPKIEFFESLGIHGPDLFKFLYSDKQVLNYSLEKRIMPTVNFLKGFLKTNENLVRVLKQFSAVIRGNPEKSMVPNISILRAHGVPEPNIRKLIMLHPKFLTYGISLFKEIVNEVKKMGFEPKRLSFILAIRSMCMLSKTNWEQKKELLTSFGWSETDFQSAFRSQPMLMLCSEQKIRELMNFYVIKVGLKPLDVARCPNLLKLSLKKRIIPRCSVLNVLMSKGLIKKYSNVSWILNISKKDFEKKFLTYCNEDCPEVINAYKGEIEFQGFFK